MGEIVVFSADESWVGGQKLAADPAVDVESAERRGVYTFHRGQFRERLAYVRHPNNPTYLVPYSEFNEFVLLDKYNEALRVLTSLGASWVRCTSFRSTSRERGARIAIGRAKFGGGAERRGKSQYDYEHSGVGRAPVDPRPLRWPGEPGMESAIDAVLRNGVDYVRITVNREQTALRDGEVPVRIKKLGVDLGVYSSSARVDTLEFEARFPGGQDLRRRR